MEPQQYWNKWSTSTPTNHYQRNTSSPQNGSAMPSYSSISPQQVQNFSLWEPNYIPLYQDRYPSVYPPQCNWNVNSCCSPPSTGHSYPGPSASWDEGFVSPGVRVNSQPIKKNSRKTSSVLKEKRRTFAINNGFNALRRCLPDVPYDTKLTKIRTLRMAAFYIQQLTDILEEDDKSRARDEAKLEKDKSSKPASNFSLFHDSGIELDSKLDIINSSGY